MTDGITLTSDSARSTGLAASNYAREPIIREVYHTTRPQKRVGRSAKRYRPRPRRRQLNLIDFQGSPIDLTTETNKQPRKNDEGIQYRPGHDHGANRKPYDIRWALGGATVFDTRGEEVGAARYPGNIIGRPLTENMFFQWGLRYTPPVHTGDLYRSVLIEKLRQGVSLDEILPRIRGGQIYSASLCDTSAITKYWTALIVFVHEAGASAFLRRVELEGLYVGFTAVSVRRVPTPTYLINPAMVQVIHSQHRTRCLAVVASPNPTLKATLHKNLTNSGLGAQVECFGEKDPEGVTSIRFHSIKAATRAYEMLADTKDLKATVQFAADPCSL